MEMACCTKRSYTISFISEGESLHKVDKMEQIVCPNCGEWITSVQRLKGIIDFCKEFWGQCRCGQKYRLRASGSEGVVLSFPDRQLDIVY